MMILSARLRLASTDLLRDPVYRRLWISILISSFGGQMTLLALPLTAALLLRAEPMQMGLLTAMEIVPYALLSLPAGVWLDRRRKLPVYVYGEMSMAFTLATVPLAWWLDRLSLTWLYVIAFVIGTVNTAAGSAAQIVLTEIVPRERLVEAYAKNSLATAAAEVSGPGIAGAVIKLVGAPVALLADAILLLASACILRGVPVQETPRGAAERVWPAMRAGLRFVRDHELLLTMVSCVGVWQMCNGAANAVQILFATQRLGLNARGIGLSYIVLGLGTVAGSAMGHGLARRIGPGPSMVLGFATGGIGWTLLALTPATAYGVVSYVVTLWLLGVGSVLISINFISLRQSVTPGRMLGRMTSTMRWLVILPAGPGALLGGWLGEHFGLRAALVLAGGVALLLAFSSWHLQALQGAKMLPTLEAEAIAPPSSE
ncbi:MAG: transporter [Gammaproteobacteria bacterium]|nr:transporter [Gammaproteobacteria bacterium]